LDVKSKAPQYRDSKLKAEEECGNIQCRVISNDGNSANYVLLTALKNIFQKQLPKMPREYITRLIYDRSHKSLLILRPASGEELKKISKCEEEDGSMPLDQEVKEALKMVVVGGITYKGFFDRGFIEIVFCAISSTEQVKGYGSYLMNHMKEQAKREGSLVQHFLTYADNYAVGYFQKQGFTKEITLDRSIWVGYIKDYDGGTLMQCTMVPGIDYLNVYEQLFQQKLALLRVIDSRIGCAKVYPGLGKSSTTRKPSDIPGVVEAGWSEELSQLAKDLAAQTSAQDQRTRLYLVLKPLLNDLIHHPASWPFRKPVDPAEVPDYLSVITSPMDLSTMSKRLENEHYKSISEFTTDLKLIADNCRKYNDPDTTYYKNANILENFYFEKLKVRELK
jgi:histone acetyltransferase